MIITHVLESLSPNGGGLPAAVKELACQQANAGLSVNVVSIADDDVLCSLKKRYNNVNFFSLNQYKIYAKTNKVNITHIHGLWCLRVLAMLYEAKKNGGITILSVHGQLMPCLLHNDSLLKKIKKIVYINSILKYCAQYADVIHSVCHEESIVLKKIFKNARHVSIYNYIDSELLSSGKNSEAISIDEWNNSINVTFIGRIESRKGLENLLKGFISYKKEMPATRIKINIVGPVDDNKYLVGLKKLISYHKLKTDVFFKSALYGEDKISLIKASSFICLPSYSEVVGLANIEGALMNRVVITTPYANISEIGVNGGYIIDNGVNDCHAIFCAIEKLSYSEYKDRASRLHKWAVASFDTFIINECWLNLFNSLCFNGSKKW